MTNGYIAVAAVFSAGANLVICFYLGANMKRRFDSLGSCVDSIVTRLDRLLDSTEPLSNVRAPHI